LALNPRFCADFFGQKNQTVKTDSHRDSNQCSLRNVIFQMISAAVIIIALFSVSDSFVSTVSRRTGDTYINPISPTEGDSPKPKIKIGSFSSLQSFSEYVNTAFEPSLLGFHYYIKATTRMDVNQSEPFMSTEELETDASELDVHGPEARSGFGWSCLYWVMMSSAIVLFAVAID
jgi:hypothetical protein